jgi:dimethylargininase
MSRLIALTREISPAIADCELTFMAREGIDLGRARAQHAAYRAALAGLGVEVTHLADGAAFPDGVFVEDLAVVLDEAALLSRPGAVSRQQESNSFGEALARYRPVTRMTAPAALDGGDVLRIGRSLYAGLSTRTNREGVEQLRRFAEPLGYAVRAVEVRGCLHLKTGCTWLGDGAVLLNPEWVSPAAFDDFKALTVDPAEPFAANVLLVGNRILYPSAFPRTLEKLRARRLDIATVDISELQKAEAGLTCMSQVFTGS